MFYYNKYNGITCNVFKFSIKFFNVPSHRFWCIYNSDVSIGTYWIQILWNLLLCCLINLFAWAEALQEDWTFFEVELVAVIDGLDSLKGCLSFFPLFQVYELTIVLIRAVIVLLNSLILLLKSLPNRHSNSGVTFFVNSCILAGNRFFVCSILNWLISAVTTPKKAKTLMTWAIISLRWIGFTFKFIILSHASATAQAALSVCMWIFSRTVSTDLQLVLTILPPPSSSLHLGVNMYGKFSGLL